MIAADSSSMVAYLSGNTGSDIDKLGAALLAGELVLPAIVITELLSSSSNSRSSDAGLHNLALLPIVEGYWSRAGLARRRLIERGLKAKVADALIAQACIDNGVALITRDKDFRHFAKHCGLKLA
jgi:predicted nucleic acid-binding protein